MSSNEERMQHLLEKGLLTAEEIEGARRLLAEAEKEGHELSLTDALIRAGVLAAKAHHVVGGLGDDAEARDVLSSGLKLLEKIGRGSQAIVYRCHQVATDRTVAVKILHATAAGDAESQQRFIQEARSAAQLTHPNIVTIHQIGFLKGTLYIVMEYVDGGSLAEMLTVRKRFDPAEAVAIVRQAAEGLRYAHSRGFIHRDIKPQNLLLTSEGVVKIADMGLVGHVASAEEGKEWKAYGTPYYISPEQVTGDPPPDFRTDLYSLGATLYEMVTGRPPFTAPTPQEIMRKHVIEPLPDAGQFVPDLPASLCALLAKALAKEPEDRYQSAADLVAALDALDFAGVETAVSAEAVAREIAPMVEGDRRRARRAGSLGLPLRAGVRGPGALADGRTTKSRKTPWVLGGAGIAAVIIAGAVGLALYLRGGENPPAAPPPTPTPLVPATPAEGVPLPSPKAPPASSTPTAKQDGEAPDYVREDEQNAAGMLKDARDTEAADVMSSQKVEAYENVIKWFPKTKAAQEARQALERLGNAPPPEKRKAPDPDFPKSEPPTETVAPGADTITVKASRAAVHPSAGSKIAYEKTVDRDNIGFWSNEGDWVSWDITVEKPGTFSVVVVYAAPSQCDGNAYVVAVGDQQLAGKVKATGDWGRFNSEVLGAVRIARAGKLTLSVKPKGKPREALMNLQAITLKRARD
jgi:serine/threonine-protein kinase